MEHYIDKDALVAEIERRTDELYNLLPNASKVEKGMITISEACNTGKYTALESFKDYIDTLETKDINLDKEAEWIANGIMIAVQSAKLHTNVYNPDRKDYDHSHLMQAARRGIELGLKIAQKGEEV